MPTLEVQARVISNSAYQQLDHQPRTFVSEGLVHSSQEIELKKIEMPIESFGQLMFVREHRLEDGRRIKKVAAISLPNPYGWQTTEEVLAQTLTIDNEAVERWDGVQQGKIIAMGKSVENVFSQFHLMDRFIELTGEASIGSEKGREHIQEIQEKQQRRRDFLLRVKMDAAELLNTPYLTQWSAWNEDYRGTGVCLIEGYVDEHGYWIARNAKGLPDRVVNVATDDPHRNWLIWGEGQLGGQMGDFVLGDGENTETVKSCRGSKGCSEYFEEMKKEGKSAIFERPTIQTTIVLPTIAASLWRVSFNEGEKKEFCKGCKHQKVECQCGLDEALSQAA